MDSIQVSIKIRPLIQREKDSKLTSLWSVSNGNTIKSNNKEHELSFDHILDENANTQQLFNIAGRRIVSSALKGINGTIFAYGQTSSGKTYSMIGNNEEPGIVKLVVREIFKEIEASEDREFLLRIGYVEIYNEKIFDLLDKDKDDLKIYESQNGDINIQQKEVIAKSENEILGHFDLGNKNKRMDETGMNEQSSRSHTIFRITIESREQGKTSTDSSVQISNLNLVDLAGSERASQSKATGVREGLFINKSILFLSLVIQELNEASESASTEKAYINYRGSKLTRILQSSLGGNAVTSIICTITPADLDETYYTLKFAQRAKKIKNKPKVNEVVSEQVMMKRLEKEISRLRLQLLTQETKMSAFETNDIEKKIADRVNQFLHSHNVNTVDNCRRRTWCPTSTIPVKTSLIPKTTKAPPAQPSSLSLRCTTSSERITSDDEEFRAGEDFNLDRTLSTPLCETELIHSLDEARDETNTTQLTAAETANFAQSNNPKPFQIVPEILLNDELRMIEMHKVETPDDPNISILTARIEELEKLLASACQEVLSTQNTLKEKSTDALQIQKEFDELSTQLIESFEEMDACRATIKNLEETLSNVNTNSSNTLRQLEQQVADMKCEKETCSVKITDLERELISEKEKNETLIELERQLADMKCEKETCSVKITDLERELISEKEKNETLIELERQLADMMCEKEICSVKMQELEQKVISAQEKNETLIELERQLADMKCEKETCSVKITDLERELISEKEKNETLIELERQLADMKCEKEICSVKMQELEQELISAQEKNETLIELEQQLADMKCEKETCSVKITDLERELISEKEKNETLIELERQLADMKCEKETCSVKMICYLFI